MTCTDRATAPIKDAGLGVKLQVESVASPWSLT